MKKFTLFLSAMLISLMSFAQTVPTNADLWEAFKPYYNTYYALKRADQPIDKVTTFASAYMQKIMTDEASEYKWLGDYVLSVATAAGVTLSTDMAAANESGWRWAVHAFFNAAPGQYGATGIDFTVAGKPENWGPYYLAAHATNITVTGATVSTEGQNIILSGKWEEKLLTVSLWQEGATKGFGTYAVEDYGPIFWGTAELTPTSVGVYTDNGDNTFTFTATATDAEGGIYNISVTGAIEPEIDWIPMPLEITNLTTEVMEFEGVTYLQLMGRNDKEGAEVMLFLNNYTGEEKTYEVNVANSYMTFGGTEITVMDGSITKSVDPELGDVFAGTVHASAVEAGETLYVEFALTMYALPPIAIELADVEIVVNEKSAIAFFNATWEGAPLKVEVSGFEEVEFKEYSECWLSIGDDVNWVDAARGPATITIENGVASLEGTFSSYATGKTYNVTLTGTLPQGPGTGLDNVQLDAKAVKVIKNGMFIINHDGKEYNAQGTTLK